MNWYAYVGNDPVNAIDPTGKVVFTFGGQVNANAGLSASAAKGRWVNITSEGVSWGSYNSGEADSAIATPSASAGFESSVLFTSDTDAALNGMYMINGADGLQVSGDIVTTLPAKGGDSVFGIQVSVDLTPSTDVGVHNRTGYGSYSVDNEKSWGTIAKDAVTAVVDVAISVVNVSGRVESNRLNE